MAAASIQLIGEPLKYAANKDKKRVFDPAAEGGQQKQRSRAIGQVKALEAEQIGQAEKS